MLHVLNGDATRDRLRASGVSGAITVWADALHDGPNPAGVPIEQWREARARFLADSGAELTLEEARRTLEGWDRAIEGATDHDEVILWFEHDLFDQLILIRLLDLLAERDIEMREGGAYVGPAKIASDVVTHSGDPCVAHAPAISLICIDRYPGVEPFIGLGQLSPEQLETLLPTRTPVTREQFQLGRAAWNAFCAPDPSRIEALLATDTSPLPQLAGALHRHLEQFPSVRDGLSRSERQALQTLAEQGGMKAGALFQAVANMEERQFLGDWSFWRYLVGLAEGSDPLVQLETTTISDAFRQQTVSITATGRAVLDGRSDWIGIRGIDRWLGGVHLRGADAAWRWDERKGRLMRT